MKPDWPTIRTHYESSDESFRQVAARFEVPFDTIKKRSSREKWHKLAEVEVAPVPNDGTSTAHSGKNGTANGTGTDAVAQNGTAEMAPVPENGAANGTDTDPVAKNGTAEMAPVPENGTGNGTDTTLAAQNGTAEMAPVPQMAPGMAPTPPLLPKMAPMK